MRQFEFFPEITIKKVSSRGNFQKFIIVTLATQISSMTRFALAKLLAKKFDISVRSAYEHVSVELTKCLIPKGIVEENGYLPAIRGPRVVQEHGTTCYRLTRLGMLIASTIDDISIDEKKHLLQRYMNSKDLGRAEAELREELMNNFQRYPEFTLELVKRAVYEFLDGRSDHPLDYIRKMR